MLAFLKLLLSPSVADVQDSLARLKVMVSSQQQSALELVMEFCTEGIFLCLHLD